MLTEGIKYGIGLHYNDMDLQKLPTTVWISYAAGFSTILATAWSKTSFGITLLRISNGWVKWFVWFIIISVNVVLGAVGTVHWVQCWPVAKLWTPTMRGTCIPLHYVEDFGTFASGT